MNDSIELAEEPRALNDKLGDDLAEDAGLCSVPMAS